MNSGYIIYSAGELALTIKKYAEALGLQIIGFYDNNKRLQGTKVDGLQVFSFKELEHRSKSQGFPGIIIGSQFYEKEIINEINRTLGNKITIIKLDSIRQKYWEQIAIPFRDTLEKHYNIDYKGQIDSWICNLMGEVEFWIKYCRLNRAEYLQRYEEIQSFFQCERLNQSLKPSDIVIDAGCGICTQYGQKLERGGILRLISMDPLAYFYNAINKKIHANENPPVCFGLFEFMSLYFESDYADVILVDNALDHCIDPFKSILECLLVLKPQGTLSMRHRRGEAVYEGYSGLHKWNMDINKDNEFIIWNQSSIINVNKELGEYVEIDIQILKFEGMDFLDINIKKKKNFEITQFYNVNEDRMLLAQVINSMMKYFADNSWNIYFDNMLNGL